MGSGYLRILRGHYNYIGYGFSHYFYSSLGQTFLISVFVNYLSKDAGIDNDGFNELYGIATICSAVALSFVGGLVDKFKVRYFSIVNALLLTIFCFVISFSNNPFILFFGLLGLRLSGQGLMPLIGSTSIARYFSQQRGKALSLSTIGLSLSETIMPAIAVVLITLFGWTWSWRILGLSVLVIFIPVVFFAVDVKDAFQGGRKKDNDGSGEDQFQTGKSRKEVLKDPVFYFLLPAVAFIPFFITGLFINHHLLEGIKGWSMEWIATCFLGYGICKVVTSFLAGPLVDRFSARKIFPFYMMPFALGMVFFLFGEHKINALAYLCLAGMSTSLMSITSTAMWTEIYGYKHLGAIKSMVTTVIVFSSALGPKIIGVFLEDAQNWQVVPIGGIAIMVLFSIITGITLNLKWKSRILRSLKKVRGLFYMI